MKKLLMALAVGATVVTLAPSASANSIKVANLEACVDTDLSHYVNNYGTCEGTPGSWVSVRIGATCVNTYADDFRC